LIIATIKKWSQYTYTPLIIAAPGVASTKQFGMYTAETFPGGYKG